MILRIQMRMGPLLFHVRGDLPQFHLIFNE